MSELEAPPALDADEYAAAELLRVELGWPEIWLADWYIQVGSEVRRYAFRTEAERVADSSQPAPSDAFVVCTRADIVPALKLPPE